MENTKKCADVGCDNPVIENIVLVGAGGGGDFQGVLALAVAAYEVYAARKKEVLDQPPGKRKYHLVTAGYFWEEYQKAMLNTAVAETNKRPSASRPPLTAEQVDAWFEALQVPRTVLEEDEVFKVPGVSLDGFTRAITSAGLLNALVPGNDSQPAKVQQFKKQLGSADYVYCSLAAESLAFEEFKNEYKGYYADGIIADPYMAPTTKTVSAPMAAAMAKFLSGITGDFEVRVLDVGGDIMSTARGGERDVSVRDMLLALFEGGTIPGFKSLQIHVAGAGVDSHTTPARALANMEQWATRNGTTVGKDDCLGEYLCRVLGRAHFARNVREQGRANGNYLQARQAYQQLLTTGSAVEGEALKTKYLQDYLLKRHDAKKEPQKGIDITAEFKAADEPGKVRALFERLAAYYVIQVPLQKKAAEAAPQEAVAASVSLTISSQSDNQ